MNKPVAYYYFRQVGRIGELVWQTIILRNLYPEDKFDLVFLVPFLNEQRCNSAVFKLCTRGIRVIGVKSESDINQFIQEHEKENTPYEWIKKSPSLLCKEFFGFLAENELNYSLKLSSDQIKQGEELKRQLGIPEGAKIVTLHVRSPSTFPDWSYHDYRDANIANYLFAVMYLVKRGYYVVRLGDKSMTPLDNIGPQVIDAPFHPLYCDLFEPYFIAASEFYIGMASGPVTLASGFGVPVLWTNALPGPGIWGRQGDIWLFKKYYSHQLARALTYEELVTGNVINYNCSEIFRESGISLLENTPEELMAAVIEMDDRVLGVYDKLHLAEQFRERSNDINLKAHVIRQCMHPTNYNPEYYLPFFPPAYLGMDISVEYILRNPGFLGHEWPEIDWSQPLIKMKDNSSDMNNLIASKLSVLLS